MNMRSILVRLVALAPLLLVTGCGGDEGGRGVPVSGKITLDGKPLADANVTFMNDTFAGFGKTDAEGKYRLVQGALPGNNKIVISKIQGGTAPEAPVPETLDPGQLEASAMAMGGASKKKGPVELIGKDYSDPSSTKLTYDIPTGGATDVDFNL